MAQYEALTAEDRLRIARDTLLAAETDHFRVSLLEQSQPNLNQLDLFGARIAKLRSVITDLEKEAGNAQQATS